MKKGTELSVTIEGMDPEAFGLVQVDGVRVRVPGVRPADEALIKVVHLSPHKKDAWARVLKNHTGTLENRIILCPDAVQAGGSCGGCPAIHLDPSTADDMKQQNVRECLRANGLDVGFSYNRSPLAFHYRNRGNFVVARRSDKRIYLGSHAPRSHRVAPMDGCLVYREPVVRIARKIAEVMTKLQVPVHPEPDGIRYVTIRAGRNEEVLVDLIAGSSETPCGPALMKELMTIDRVIGVSMGQNDNVGNAIRVQESSAHMGEPTVLETVGSVSVPLTAETFSQLNSEVAGIMYQKAATFGGRVKVIWDLYCGVGGLGLSVLAQHSGARLFGADFVSGAVGLARIAAGSAPAVFEVLNLQKEMPAHWPAPDLVLINPPRRGLDTLVAEEIVALLPGPSLVYMSCNPSTFARDAALFTANGWQLHTLEAFDMLPQTTHVELLGFFEHTSQ